MKTRIIGVRAFLIGIIALCAAAQGQESPNQDDAAWRERLLAVQESDRWFVGARIGMDLARIPGERPYRILAASWPEIATSARKQILKGFSPGMGGNTELHPMFFEVMHLGMSDPDPGVRSFASTYIQMQVHVNFEQDLDRYALWREQNKGRTAAEIVADAAVPPPTDPQAVTSRMELIRRALADDNTGAIRKAAEELAELGDPSAIPFLIGAIDADNSSGTIYSIGCNALARWLDVKCSRFHDGPWWRRWWEANKARFPQKVQDIPIPDLPKTSHGRTYVPFPEDIDTADGKLRFMRQKFEAGDLDAVRDLARELAEMDEPRAIPLMIGIIDADNSSDTIYGVAYFGLSRMLDVKYSPFHDGPWWRRWWEANKARFPQKVQGIPIPDLPKTAAGRAHTPFPEDIDTLEGKLRWVSDGVTSLTDLLTAAGEIAGHKDARAVPTLIGLIEADNTYDTIYGVGYFGLSPLTGVDYDEMHDGAWWRKWWEENNRRFPEDVQSLEIPDMTEAVGRMRRAEEERQARSLAEEFAGLPDQDLIAAGNPRMRYFLMGPREGADAPAGGFGLVLILAGGDGSADFHPFCMRILKNAMPPGFVAAHLVAPVWTDDRNRVVWPTLGLPDAAAEFTTEAFIASVVKDVRQRVDIDPRRIFTLGWSSSGPALYAMSLRPDSPVTGTFVAMSVFRPQLLPDLAAADGHPYYILHSPDDWIKFDEHAAVAARMLGEHGANVKLQTYAGGHGWHGDVFGNIRRGIDWLNAASRAGD